MRYAALAVFAAGCLYTDGINQKPVVRDIAPAQTPTRWDREVQLHVDAFDPDGDPFTLDYALAMPFRRDDSRDISFRPTGPGEYTITATATDDQGASGSLERSIVIPNMTPQPGPLGIATADAAPIGSDYPLMTRITIVMNGYDDDDATHSEDWHFLQKPAGSTATLDLEHAFTADLPGTYDVEVTVTDPHEARASQHLAVTIAPDRPPCIRGTLPSALTDLLVFDAGTRNSLAVTSVDDDLNPFPAGPHGAARFVWSVKRATDTSFVVLDGFLQPSFLLDGSGYTAGEQVQVRVEVSDATSRMPMCPYDQRECDYSSGCAGRLTWAVEFR